jgi:hypothetical protein
MRFVALSCFSVTLALAGCQSKAAKVQKLQEQYNAEYPAYAKDCLDEDTAGASRMLTGEKLTKEEMAALEAKKKRGMNGASRRPTILRIFSAKFSLRSSNANPLLDNHNHHRTREEIPMRKMTLIPLAIGLTVALQPIAHAQFGSGVVYDPTQSVHAVVQIENEEKSIANEVQQIEQGQQIFSNTVKIATTALQAYNVANQQYQLAHEMILAPRMLYSRFLSPTTDLMMMQQISNTYGNSMGWLNSANTGMERQPPTSRPACREPPNMIPGYSSKRRRAAADCRAGSNH